MALRQRIGARLRRPSPAVVRGGSAGTAIALALALVVMLNLLGWKYHHRADWTGEQLYTLSEKTKNVLAAVDRDVRVSVLLSPADPAWEPTRELLARYEAASPRLSVRHVDPEVERLEAQQLVDRYQLSDAAVVFDDGEDRRVVLAPDLVEYDFTGLRAQQGPEVAAFRGEQRFTRAVLDLTQGEKPRVLFTTGHGEISLDDRSRAGLSEARRLLGDDNFELEEWASLGAATVPAGTDLIAVAGPTSTFLEPELELFGDYLEGGGRMLFLLDPVLGGAGRPLAESTPLGLEEWLAGYGVEVGPEVLVDPGNPVPVFGAGTQFSDSYPDEHPVTRSVRQGGLPVITSLVRPVGLGDVPEDLQAAVLFESSPESWGETEAADAERGPDDRPGPVPLAVAITGPGADEDAPAPAAGDDDGADGEDDGEGDGDGDEAAGPAAEAAPGTGLRLVVFGDSTFATDQLLAANAANATLLADTLNWMVEREAALGIPPKKPEVVRLSLTVEQVRWTFLLVMVLLPALAILGAVVTRVRRRR